MRDPRKPKNINKTFIGFLKEEGISKEYLLQLNKNKLKGELNMSVKKVVDNFHPRLFLTSFMQISLMEKEEAKRYKAINRRWLKIIKLNKWDK